MVQTAFETGDDPTGDRLVLSAERRFSRGPFERDDLRARPDRPARRGPAGQRAGGARQRAVLGSRAARFPGLARSPAHQGRRRGSGVRGAAARRGAADVASNPPHPPYVAHLLPICRNARDIFVGVDRLLVVTPATMKVTPTVAGAGASVDMTPDEATLARQVGAARSLDETLPRRLEALLAKMGVGDQPDLSQGRR